MHVEATREHLANMRASLRAEREARAAANAVTQPITHRSAPHSPFTVEEHEGMSSWARVFYVVRQGSPRRWVHLANDARQQDECTCHAVRPCEHIDAARSYVQRNG